MLKARLVGGLNRLILLLSYTWIGSDPLEGSPPSPIQRLSENQSRFVDRFIHYCVSYVVGALFISNKLQIE